MEAIVDLWECSQHFNISKVHKKVTGTKDHHYEHPHISKQDLADAVKRVSEAVEILFNRSKSNYNALGDLTIGTEKDRGVVARLEKRINDLELKLLETNEKLKNQETELSSDIQSNALGIENLNHKTSQIKEITEENGNTIHILQRTAEKQQQVITRNKLDIKKAIEYLEEDSDFDDEDGENGESENVYDDGETFSGGGGTGSVAGGNRADGGGGGRNSAGGGGGGGGSSGNTATGGGAKKGGKRRRNKGANVDTSTLSLTADQIFCRGLSKDEEEKNGETCDDLVSLANIIELLNGNHCSLDKKVQDDSARIDSLEAHVETLAAQESLQVVDNKVDTVCENIDHLLESFHTAGILEDVPPPIREDVKTYQAETDKKADNPLDELYGSDDDSVYGSESPQSENKENVSTENSGVLNNSEIRQKLDEIRSEYKSSAIGHYKVTKAVKDLEERLGDEADAIVEDVGIVKSEINTINIQLGLKMEAEHVDEKIEIKFDEVVQQLETAIQAAGADEEEFKRAARELQDTCSQLMTTKANQSELIEMKRKMELDSKVADQVKQLQKYTSQKMDIRDAKELIGSRVAKEELGRKLTMLHRKLVDEMEDTINVKQGIKPFAVGKGCSPGGENHATPIAALTCLACNRRVTKGQMNMLHGPGKCEKKTHLTHGGGFRVKLPVMNSASPRHGIPRDAPKVIVFDNDEPGISQWSQGMLEPINKIRPQTVGSNSSSSSNALPQKNWRAQTANSSSGRKSPLRGQKRGPRMIPLPHEAISPPNVTESYESSAESINNMRLSNNLNENASTIGKETVNEITIQGADGNPVLQQVPVKVVHPTF